MRVVNGNLLVKLAKEPECTDGGIFRLNGGAIKAGEGTVVEAASGTVINKNSYVFFSAYSGVDIVVNGEKLRVVPEKDVLVVVDETIN